MPSSRLSTARAKAAHRYLQASMAAGATGLPRAQRDAYESQLRGLELKHEGIRRHAIAGTRRHFDLPLSAGEREHQRHLREREGIGEGEAAKIREELDAAAAKRSRASAGPRAAKAAAGAGAGAIASVAGGGSTFMYFVGGALFLILIYLFVAGKGARVLEPIVGVVTGAAHTFVAPVDPIAALEHSLKAAPLTPVAAAAGTTSPSSSAASSSTSAPAPSSRGGPTPPAPSQAGALTWPALQRAIKGRKLSPAQVRADIKALQSGHPAWH